MALRVVQLDNVKWENALAEHGCESVFGHVGYLDVIQKTFGVAVCKLAVVNGGCTDLLAVFYIRKGKIVCPSHYLHQFSWLRPQMSEWRTVKVLKFLAKELIAKYHRINLMLKSSYNDIRPFIWTGFKSTVRYTYIKPLCDLTYQKKITDIIEKNSTDLEFKETDFLQEAKVQHFRELRALLGKKFAKQSVTFFDELFRLDYAKLYSIYYKGLYVSSAVVVIDEKSKKSYLHLVGKTESVKQFGASAKLYDFVFRSLKADGFEYLDLCGANTESIASFKSKFGARLSPYYLVNYNRLNDVFQHSFAIAKKIVFGQIKRS